jgi:hypothetical protein
VRGSGVVPRRLGWVLAAAALTLASCSAHPSQVASNRLTVQIVLNTAQVAAGDPIKGHLVVNNPNASINLTQLVRGHCEPSFAVVLMQGSFRNDIGFTAECSPRPLEIVQGTTRFSITVLTSYSGCLEPGGSSSVSTPHCLSGNRSPPLPQGSYKAVIEWSTSVPLPKPAPVDVTLT